MIARGMAASAQGSGGTKPAADITYNNATSGLAATNVQGALDELCVNVKNTVQVGSVALSTSWTGANSPYMQNVTVTGATVTANSKIDLQPSSEQLNSLGIDGVTAMLVKNTNGQLAVYAYGSTPYAAITLQCTVTEV